MNRMNNYRESLFELLHGGKPGGIVWTADITYWISGQNYLGTSRKEWNTEEGYLKLCRDQKIMPYYWYEKFWLGEPAYDSKVTLITDKNGPVTVNKWITPLGEISEEIAFIGESYSAAHTKYAVQKKNDLDILKYILEHRHLKPACIDDYPERLKLWAKYDGLPSIALPRSPLSAFFYEWAGVQNGVYLLMDYPDEIREIFALMEEQEKPVIDAVCDLAPPLVHFADNLSSDNIAGLYDDFMAAGHKKRLERIHAAGTACAVHLDGVVRGLLPKLASAGFDAVEALTPKPGGDLDSGEMRAIAGNDSVILWGGVPGIMFAPPYTWNDMEKRVIKTLEAWKGTRFVLGVADQVPPDGDLEFCSRIAEIVEEFSTE